MVEKKERHTFKRLFYGRTIIILLSLLLQIALILALMFRFLERIPALFGGVVVFTAVMLAVILNTRDNPTVKLSWCILVAVMPVFGMVLYLFFRLDIGHRVEQKLLRKTQEETRSYTAAVEEFMEKLRREDRNFYNTAYYLQKNGFPVCGNTNVQYFPLGEDKFRQMLIELEQAEKFIFMEYFIISPSYMWDRILEILKRKAAMGVEVRVLYDGSNAVTNLPYDYPKQMARFGIRCKMFSPFRPFVSTHYNNRDHRKILVIDGKVAFTGGINIQDRYINRKQVFGHWKDTAVMLRGDAARSFTLMFLQMWNATEKEHIYDPYLEIAESVPASGLVIPYGDSPLDDERVGEMVYFNMINQAKEYVYIMTPYLIMDNEMVTALRFAAMRGVDVRIVVPHIPDKKAVFLLTRSHYAELLEAGVKIYEYTPGFVHAKVFLCDDIQAVVGTINLDYRSLYHHFECAAYLYRVDALADIKVDFQNTMEKSQQVSADDGKRRSFLTGLLTGILKIAAPLV